MSYEIRDISFSYPSLTRGVLYLSKDSILKEKSMAFAKRIVRLYQFLTQQKREFVMAKQILRSGTSIGANIAEAIFGSSKKDFVAKLQIAKKKHPKRCTGWSFSTAVIIFLTICMHPFPKTAVNYY